ncbi:hypothetical protein DCO58_08370 [Helicobacter saguini]|uniref:Cell division topological specificity factor n=1 Tax=Helicobacter saguini TaxID=1548018 RepID=A0A347VLQ2_9HELI|nr:cell division topological specificity factor MinE [Helicobacter saguini]MWV61662.1 hypothetical protein [Helicobacter saguini]MWV67666.1 hypothetical protein [Helicobacter saguini]MWV70018.1 hypothetical protein [Helicobacter saguini]MWV72769.1 hypothetical protein [Helicobacter saguini]TLD92720.1 hypothetical protein LS64_009865 [Helicobacter saguini]
MFFLRFKDKGTASTAKKRLQETLANDRNANIAYLDDLKNDIITLIRKYSPNSCVDVNACANRNNTLDIKVNIKNI